MRSTRSHRGNQRAHKKLTAQRFSVATTGAVHPRHKALLDGTPYRGRSVMDKTRKQPVVSTKESVRTEKKSKKKEKTSKK